MNLITANFFFTIHRLKQTLIFGTYKSSSCTSCQQLKFDYYWRKTLNCGICFIIQLTENIFFLWTRDIVINNNPLPLIWNCPLLNSAFSPPLEYRIRVGFVLNKINIPIFLISKMLRETWINLPVCFVPNDSFIAFYKHIKFFFLCNSTTLAYFFPDW